MSNADTHQKLPKVLKLVEIGPISSREAVGLERLSLSHPIPPLPESLAAFFKLDTVRAFEGKFVHHLADEPILAYTDAYPLLIHMPFLSYVLSILNLHHINALFCVQGKTDIIGQNCQRKLN